MKKLILYVFLATTGLMTSCIDKYEEVDADSKPSWLNESIYGALENPSSSGLTGTFTNYLKLIDDLGYDETLNKTGSKTIFPANDSAFARFFASNSWGVSSYEQLTETQKKLLLYTSMLDNALLTSMLSNVSSGSATVNSGMAVKHVTNLSVTDSVQNLSTFADMPQSNSYWTDYANKGINVVRDGTAPMLVHFTREQMVNNNISITGDGSDFEILTGSPYEEGDVYVFKDKVIASDITCQNGYIHQVKDVLVPPGNMAQVIHDNSETSLFSRMLDYFAAPYYDATITTNYNDWAVANGKATIDSIFQWRYLSSRSQDATLVVDPKGYTQSTTRVLSYDPGWNQYYPSHANSSSVDYTITDIGAMFVPNDQAVKDYFLEGGTGAYLIDIYGSKENTEANLLENLDSLHKKNPQVLTTFIRNLQKTSFVSTVPSKFTSIMNDANDNMGMNMSYLATDTAGKYDVRIANNGVIYVMNQMIAPSEYEAVLAPSSSYPDMQIMNWAVQDATYLGVDFKYYLLAMSANYAFFIPDDAAFDLYYIDPVRYASTQPEALRFYYDESHTPALRCDRYYYDVSSGEIGSRIGEVSIDLSRVKSQLVDILNYHTLVLNSGEVIGDNKFYKTKHGGEIYVEGGNVGDKIMTGANLDNGLPAAEIEIVYPEKNGCAYRMNRVIAPTMNSVYKTLHSYDRFSEFSKLCEGFAANDILTWAGVSPDIDATFGTSEQDRYQVFTSTYSTLDENLEKVKISNACMDMNVNMFNTYNYTLYAPNNDAMQEAYSKGLPSWSDLQELFLKWADTEETSSEMAADKAKAKAMLKVMREFVRYQFHNISVYADNTVESGTYQTMHTDDMGLSDEVIITGGGNKFIVTDGAGIQHTIDATNSSLVSNKMARDYWFDANVQEATTIETSSFCAVHEVTKAFMTEEQGEKDTYRIGW